MNTTTWSAHVPDSVAHARAGGRRHYNSLRQLRATLRRREVVELLMRGRTQSQIARRLGVHPSTISRDVAWLNQLATETRHCPVCGHTIDALRALAHREGE